MIYIFKDRVLLRTVEKGVTPQYLNDCDRKAIPTDSYVYDAFCRSWFVKRTRKYVRPLPDGIVPKELKVLLLLLGVSCG